MQPPGLDGLFVELAKEVPGFGGFHFDLDGNTVVHLVDLTQEETAKTAIAPILANHPAVVGPPDARRFAPGTFVFRQARYDFLQLSSWKIMISHLLANSRGVVFIDADEQQNRVLVGITSESHRPRLEASITALGIPAGAVRLEKASRPRTTNHSLGDVFPSVPGGVYITGSGACTVGFNLTFGAFGPAGVHFLTNSHCTFEDRAGNDGTFFYQPHPAYGGYIGYENVDPYYFTGGDCPSSAQCRWSDAAAVIYDGRDYEFGYIARTIGRSADSSSTALDPNNPRFRIASVQSFPLGGERLDKIGASSGWTTGIVQYTCRNFFAPEVLILPTPILLCQDVVDFGVSDGDSGSPVFSWGFGDTVTLYGILWGEGESDPYVGMGVFSALWNIQEDLGTINVVDP